MGLYDIYYNVKFVIFADVDKEALRNYIGKWVPTPEKKSTVVRKATKESMLAEFLTYFDVMNRDQWAQYQVRGNNFKILSFLSKFN